MPGPTPFADQLKWFSLQELKQGGFIDLDHVPPPEYGFGYLGEHQTPAAKYRNITYGDLPCSLTEAWIHPIFAPHMWTNPEMRDQSRGGYWDKLRPVWQLATLFLEEQLTCGYWVGLLDISNHIRIAHPKLGAIYTFEAKSDPTHAEMNRIWKDLLDLRSCVRLGYKTLNGPDGLTSTRPDRPGLGPDGMGSDIFMDEAYIQVLCQNIPCSVPDTDLASAFLRRQWHMAKTLVHELAHALWSSKHLRSRLAEPYYKDTRIAELGHQWEKNMFSGKIFPTVFDTHISQGFRMRRWPGVFSPPTGGVVAQGYVAWGGGQPWFTFYAVPMAWIQRFFTVGFWDQVQRYGVTVLEPERTHGSRVWLKEVDVPLPSRDPLSPLSDDGDGGFIIRAGAARSYRRST